MFNRTICWLACVRTCIGSPSPRNIHQQARELVASGFNRVFLGTILRHAGYRKDIALRGLFQRPNRAGQLAYRLKR